MNYATNVRAIRPSVEIGFIIAGALLWLVCFAALITPGWRLPLSQDGEAFLAAFVHAVIVGLPIPLFYLTIRLFSAERDLLARRRAFIVAILFCVTPVLFIFIRYVIPTIYEVLSRGIP